MKIEKGKTYTIKYQPKSSQEGRPFQGTARYTGTKKVSKNGETVFEFQAKHSLGFFPKDAIRECKKS